MDNKAFRTEPLMFTETPDVYDFIAYAFTSYIKTHLEHHIDREFNGFLVTNMCPFAESKFKGKHPKSILEKDNPFLSLTYTIGEENRDLALSSSALITDFGSAIDPKYTSDLILRNDSFNPEQNIDIRLQFSNMIMNCDIMVIEDSEMCQISTRRVWDTIFETDKPYSFIIDCKIPLNKKLLYRWSKVFDIDIGDIDNDFKNIDDMLNHLQEHSDFKFTIEKRLSQNKNWIYIRIPMELLITFTESDVQMAGEEYFLIKNYIIHRRATIFFNCPNMYWIVARENFYKAELKGEPDKNVAVIDDIGYEYVDRVTDNLELNGIAFMSLIHLSLYFERNNNIISLRKYMWQYENFLRYLERMEKNYTDGIYILIREPDEKYRESIESTDKILISYKPDFLIKLIDERYYDKAFDIKIYFNNQLMCEFKEWREKFMFTDYQPIYDIADKPSEEITMSDSLKALLK